MLSSIHPFGERSRDSTWWVTVGAYLAGTTVAGALSGLAVGLLGIAIDPLFSASAALAVLGVAAVAGLAADLHVGGVGIPTLHRQVNEDWLTTYRGWVYGLGFGFQLGLGFATIVTTSTVWLAFLAAALTGSLAWAVAIGSLFGFARGVLIFATINVQTPAALRQLFRTIEATGPQVHRGAIITVALAAGTAGLGLLLS